jgi:paired amphipathic helix protein Sin3a
VGEERGSNCRLNNVAGNGMAMVAADNTQCRFNINAYRMVFVVNKENLLYKRQALHRARQVSFMDAQFSSFFYI